MITLKLNNSDVYLLNEQILNITHNKEDKTVKVRYADGNTVTYTGIEEISFK